MNRKWNSGPPPHVGWWNASTSMYEDIWRWWNGREWSIVVFEGTPGSLAAELALVCYPSTDQSTIQWTDYWPENARVPRIDPRRVK